MLQRNSSGTATLVVLALVVSLSSTIPTTFATTNLRRRMTVDDMDNLNLDRAELYLPGGTTVNETTPVVVSCHRTFSKDGGGGWHGECDGGYDANFLQQQQQPQLQLQQRSGDWSGSSNSSSTISSSATTFGTFRTGQQVCRIAPDATGMTTIECTNEDEFELEEESDLEEVLDDDETHERKLASLNVTFAMSHVADLYHHSRRRLFDDSGSTIDLLVVWTPLAECINSKLSEKCKRTARTESNMRGLINLAVVETNVAFSLSNIQTRLRLVHAYRDDSYEEPVATSTAPNVWTTMLEQLTQVTDGKLDSVHVKRVLYGADVVHLVAGSLGACGAAHVGPQKNRVFSMSRTSCATGYYSFGHEIAHSVCLLLLLLFVR
jgi:Metallo-peptidase family M12B Reprolysin-like